MKNTKDFSLRICGTNSFRLTFLIPEDITIPREILSPREEQSQRNERVLVPGAKINPKPLKGCSVGGVPEYLEGMGFGLKNVFMKTKPFGRSVSFVFEREVDEVASGTATQQRFLGWLTRGFSWDCMAFRNGDGTVALSCASMKNDDAEFEVVVTWKATVHPINSRVA